MTFGRGAHVIFLHGWGGSTESFRFVADKLSERFTVTLLDFYGFGDTPEPETPFGVRDCAEGVVEVMNNHGITSATFVCHSFGGRVGLELAAKKPHLIDKLVLIDAAGLKPRRKPTYYAKIWLHKLLKAFGRKGLKGSNDYRALTPVMRASFVKIVNYHQDALLTSVRRPVAVFWGKQDRETPPYMARRFKRKLPDCALFFLNGGHFAYVDDFGRFLAILQAFLGETEAGSKP
ncbi:MAG: alpha/beta hydrolase [Clostridiaceae bacterium]|nr:alpha/beta hydrolase [Clostridiaceae bacterium]